MNNSFGFDRGQSYKIDPDLLTLISTAFSVASVFVGAPNALRAIKRNRVELIQAREQEESQRRELVRKILDKLREANDAFYDLRSVVDELDEGGEARFLDEKLSLGTAALELSQDQFSRIDRAHRGIASANHLIFSNFNIYLNTASRSSSTLDGTLIERLSVIGDDINRIFSGECTYREAIHVLDDCIYQARQALEDIRRMRNR